MGDLKGADADEFKVLKAQLDAQILIKQLGCNAVRTSHYPQSQAFLDACDELGLLVFVEMPGWQHIGDESWQAQALQNCREMVCQCRNHPSVFLWGVRVNGSPDDEAFYKRTNEAVRRLDPTRPTGGAHIRRKDQLLEDVYAYNDFSYTGRGAGCENRSAVTPDLRKGYLISEFGGQQFPAKTFDDEPHRLAQALHHAASTAPPASQLKNSEANREGSQPTAENTGVITGARWVPSHGASAIKPVMSSSRSTTAAKPFRNALPNPSRSPNKVSAAPRQKNTADIHAIALTRGPACLH